MEGHNGENSMKEENTKDPSGGGKDQHLGLSKNQMKKQLRIQKWAETKQARRRKEREKIKEKKRKVMEERRKDGIEDGPPIKRTKMSDPEASHIRVAIDCAYDELMKDTDIKKLVKQIQRCYAENRKAVKPLQFYLCSLKDKTKDLMKTLIQGYTNWDVHFQSEGPGVAFGSESVVYLAAESPNVLEELSADKVYIIGGLVDHNHHKGICYNKIREQGWDHAQLPIGDFVKLNSRKVLAINHVYEIILAYIQTGNWRDAFFQVLPNRKVKEYISKQEDIPGEPESSSAITHSKDSNDLAITSKEESNRDELSLPRSTLAPHDNRTDEGKQTEHFHSDAMDYFQGDGKVEAKEDSNHSCHGDNVNSSTEKQVDDKEKADGKLENKAEQIIENLPTQTSKSITADRNVHLSDVDC